VTGKHHVVCEKHIIAEPAIMRDMCLRQQSAAIADARRHATARSAGINRHAFANDAIGADLKRGRLTGELSVLWRMPDRGERKDARASTYLCASGNYNMRDEFDAGAENHVASEMTERTDRCTIANLRAVLY
jgi:hypothetical protein